MAGGKCGRRCDLVRLVASYAAAGIQTVGWPCAAEKRPKQRRGLYVEGNLMLGADGRHKIVISALCNLPALLCYCNGASQQSAVALILQQPN